MINISHCDGRFDDWPELLSLIQSAFSYMENRISPPSSLRSLTVESIEKKARNGTLLLAWDSSILVGCVFIDELENALYIGKLAIAPNSLGKGIGKALINACKELAIRSGKAELELQTRIELKENHLFFSSVGFEKTGETAHEGFDHPTSITMRHRLSS